MGEINTLSVNSGIEVLAELFDEEFSKFLARFETKQHLKRSETIEQIVGWLDYQLDAGGYIEMFVSKWRGSHGT